MSEIRRCGWAAWSRLAVIGIVLSVPYYQTSAFADQDRDVRKPQPSPKKWSVRIRAGWTGSAENVNGKGQLPPPAPLMRSDSSFPLLTRRVPSWFFGSGADLLNAVNSNHFLAPNAFQPLDEALTGGTIRHRSAPVLGLGVSRQVSGKVALVMQLDISRTGVSTRGRTDDAVAATRHSFEEYWRALRILDSASTVATDVHGSRPAREYAISAGVETPLFRDSNKDVFLRATAGAVVAPDDARSVTLRGTYSFQVTNPARQSIASFRETDAIRMDFSGRKYRPVASLGVGFRRQLTSGLSLEVYQQVSFARDTVSMRVSAAPARDSVSDPSLLRSGIVSIVGSGAEPGGVPLGLVFNSNRELYSAIRPSLSGDPLTGFTTFSGTAKQLTSSTTAGVSWRF